MNTIARLAAAALLLFCSVTGHALDKVTFLTNWYAEAEHGGFYQAVAEGIYEKYGLDVKIGMRARGQACAGRGGRGVRLGRGRGVRLGMLYK